MRTSTLSAGHSIQCITGLLHGVPRRGDMRVGSVMMYIVGYTSMKILALEDAYVEVYHGRKAETCKTRGLFALVHSFADSALEKEGYVRCKHYSPASCLDYKSSILMLVARTKVTIAIQGGILKAGFCYVQHGRQCKVQVKCTFKSCHVRILKHRVGDFLLCPFLSNEGAYALQRPSVRFSAIVN